MLSVSEYITFDDVLIEPRFSKITSRKDVDITTKIGNLTLATPVISANMDTIFSIELALAMAQAGGCAVVHRFCSIEENVELCKNLLVQSSTPVIASIGITKNEFERAEALVDAGVKFLCIDVAHGAQLAVVEQYNALAQKFGSKIEIIVGNFATGESIEEFKYLCSSEPLAFKVGIGGGSACLTRVQTGCGVPQFSALMDCQLRNPRSNLISDGAHRTPGDVAKALGIGAKAVMLGIMFAGTAEAPGEIIDNKFKKYRGSASLDSYKVQGKEAKWRTYEGDSFLVPLNGTVESVMQNITGGLRSALSYVGAADLPDFRQNAKFLRISNNSKIENTSHGKGS
ncbi:guanosine monophosphate reductase [Bartonella sp. TP]|uniref:guanosine monophosphate reductase n=1 Tax=Bartonella sp. TP TaxID=3057550 RepID=UPI0025B1AE86|nr:guanosine monophosphate reductase [Bartonella sp. TP]WJW80015.1 guanosine monophosphate reductase [Bartonella sp. TP]